MSFGQYVSTLDGSVYSVYSSSGGWSLSGTVIGTAEQTMSLGYDKGSSAPAGTVGATGSFVFSTITELLSQRALMDITGTERGITLVTTRLLESNRYRKFVSIVNDSDTVMYLALGSHATVNNGVRLGTENGEKEFQLNWTGLYFGEVWAIQEQAGTKNVTIIEAE